MNDDLTPEQAQRLFEQLERLRASFDNLVRALYQLDEAIDECARQEKRDADARRHVRMTHGKHKQRARG